ncbi:uncharacterized protein J4E78_002005 [Alternaria triticimaculans]|uniref:uncharacterized protein n=1 Tax=Alternaria triticimaculans TaxID=297637 RepID=UPI0020C27BB0|nr:uncharacterized protein J4E78_002005 [Alternaria triticimaculans]XP_049248692.1 uncharacterized protein J4E84_000536 [Alternaria hordeiaustralica]KAI4668181.1 hypothetical protein J4E78_002005 [Alternaria triticimaculans]KAI4697406.1 hypothetical protein J4E84_000536 [Alternaria hordeiaustralica]
MFLATIKLFSFLINPEFWARTGFFVGYIIAFLLVLEVVRLASTDANRKEVEKLLDAYAASRSDVPTQNDIYIRISTCYFSVPLTPANHLLFESYPPSSETQRHAQLFQQRRG